MFDQKKNGVNELIASNKLYEAQTILEQLADEYRDEKVMRFIAKASLKLLCKDDKLRNDRMLDKVFHRAERDFFDSDLCSNVVGILLLIETPTEDEVISEIGNRMTKMAPDVMGEILTNLPQKISRPHLKKELEAKLEK